MKLRFFQGAEPLEVDVAGAGAAREVRLGERTFHVEGLQAGGAEGALVVDGRPVRYLVERSARAIRVSVFGECFEFDLSDREGPGRSAAGMASPETRSPMPGKVLTVETEVGARVEPGTPLLVLEAMKMENLLTAEIGGTVVEVHVRPGDMVEPGKLLVRIEPEKG